MPLNITTSPNIASLDFAEMSNLCTGIFSVDLSPSIWIGSGASNVLGANVKITNPYGVVIKEFTTSGYDIYPPMTETMYRNVPTQAGNYQYGTYIFEVQLIDADGTIYTLSKPVNITAPNPLNKNVKFGSLSAILDGNCVAGKVTVIADTPPTYKGTTSDSQINAFTLEYPTSSGLPVLDTDIGSFSATLFEGVYKFNGTICAHYSLGDNISAYVNYKVKREKNIRCLLDKSCVATRLAALQGNIDSDCSDAEKIATQNTIIEALLLLTVIDGLANSGQDASDFIGKLEDVLECVCTCNCADGTPIINNNPTGDFLIEGCNVTREEVDLTTVWTIENYEYVIAITGNGGALTITAPTLLNCTKTQTITFNIDTIYAQVKAQIANSTQYNYWASVVNHAWDSLDLTCLATPTQWSTWTFAQRSQWLFNILCIGGTCEGVISDDEMVSFGNDVTIQWEADANVFEVAVYMDNILVGTVLSPELSFTIEGAADGTLHEYRLISKCSNGVMGNQLAGSFNYFGCPTIAAPTVSSNNVTEDCPFDLTSLVAALPSPIIAEWHDEYNTNASSLVSDPTQASDGVYYVYGLDAAQGCYSAIATRVVLSCEGATSCSAPQTLLVQDITSGFKVSFQSAAYPPPGNSYTVKRRLKADPDVSGSYTTIGTPTWNATSARWEILDNTALDNTLYTYRAISNCASSAPYIGYDFANLSCPTLALTPADETMDYSFTGVGGSVDKYEVSIYESDQITLIHTDTIIPAFPNPITGTFIYLTAGTGYAVRIRVFIGTYYQDCLFITSTTTGGGSGGLDTVIIDNDTVDGTISGFSGISGMASESVVAGDSATGTHTAFTGSISVFFSVGATATSNVQLYRRSILLQTVSRIAGATSTVNFNSQTFLLTDDIHVIWF